MGLTLSFLAVGVLALQSSQQDPADASTQAQQAEPLLKESELNSLNKKYCAYIEAEMKYDSLPDGRKRQAARKSRSKARDAFEREWDKRSKNKNLLGSMADLRQIYANAFPYDRLPSNIIKDQVASFNTKGEGPRYEAFVPKSYKPDTPVRSVLLVPGQTGDEDGGYEAPRPYFDSTWKGSELAEDTVFVIPQIDAAIDLTVEPDFSRAGADALDDERRRAVLLPAGYAQRAIHFDRERLLLDCGRGSSKFGLRLATYFPGRFAGLILRWPEDAKVRYDSLAGVPILLVQSAANAEFCAELKKQLDAYKPDACTILEAKGDYPFAEMQTEIGAWAANVERNVNRERIVIAPNHDRFNKGYWINIGTAEPLDTVSKADLPLLDAKVDRAANKIEVSTRSITNFIMLLNDDIVDLDKEVSIVINGIAEKKLYRRRRSLMEEIMKARYDPTQIFPVEVRLAVPETDSDK